MQLPVISVRDEDEQEPEPVRRKPIVSVNGRDVQLAPPKELRDRKSA